MSFAIQVYSGRLPLQVKLGTLTVSVALAFLTYRFVETPVRRGKYSLQLFGFLPAAICMLAVISLSIYLNDGLSWRYATEQAFNDVPKTNSFVRIDNDCLKKYGKVFADGGLPKRDFCLSANIHAPSPIILIGDSHASKLYQGFLGLGVKNIVHLGRGSCAPVSNLEPADPWYRCQPTVNRIIQYSLDSDTPLIVLTGVFERYFDGTYGSAKTAQELELDVRRWFELLGSAGKPVLVVFDNPTLPFEPKECMRRPINFDQRSDCSFGRAHFDKEAATYKAMFVKAAASFQNVTLLDSSDFFCDQNRCSAVNENGLLYTGDNNHLSLRGAMMVDRKIIDLYPRSFAFGPSK